MKSPSIADLQAGQQATGDFLVVHKDVRQKKSGEPYLSLTLADRSGEIDAKMFDNAAAVMNTFERDHFVRVKALPQVHQNRLQLVIHTLARLNDGQVDLADFLPASKRDPEEMLAELRGIIASMRDPHLRALLEVVFADEEIARKYKRAPAAKSIHHAWLGGLIEHVLSLCALCRLVGPHYPAIDMDLLFAGAILHDIGKIDELAYDRAFTYSDLGQLVGHIVIGLRIVDEKIRQVPGFPPKLRTLLDHLILSHHGSLEFGSPKVPVFAEALLLHHLDNLDSKMEAARGAVEKDKHVEGVWTGFVNSLDRSLLKKDRYLNPPPAKPPASKPSQSDNSGSVMAERLRQALRGD